MIPKNGGFGGGKAGERSISRNGRFLDSRALHRLAAFDALATGVFPFLREEPVGLASNGCPHRAGLTLEKALKRPATRRSLALVCRGAFHSGVPAPCSRPPTQTSRRQGGGSGPRGGDG